MNMLKFIAVVMLTGLVTNSSASSFKGLVVDDLAYGGSGCPTGSASTHIGLDGKGLFISFDQFIVENSRKNCGLTISITSPAGFQVSLAAVDYSGYVAPNTKARLSTDYFFAGQSSRPIVRVIDGESSYNLRNNVDGAVWSGCGVKDNMRLNVAMTASGAGHATIESVSSYGLLYSFNLRPC